MSLDELKTYLNGLYGNQPSPLDGGESINYPSSIVVRSGNPCAEIALPIESLPSQGTFYDWNAQDCALPFPDLTTDNEEVSKFLMIG